MKTRQEMEGERQREQDDLYREQERGGGYAQPTGHGGDEVSIVLRPCVWGDGLTQGVADAAEPEVPG